MLGHLDRAAGLEVDLLGPVHGHIFVRAQQRAVGAVEHIGKAVAIEMRESFDLLTVDVHVSEHVLVDAVIVPLIEGRHLISPDCLTIRTLRAKIVIDHLLSHLPLLHSSWVTGFAPQR